MYGFVSKMNKLMDQFVNMLEIFMVYSRVNCICETKSEYDYERSFVSISYSTS